MINRPLQSLSNTGRLAPLFSASTSVANTVQEKKGTSYERTLTSVLKELQPQFDNLDPALTSVVFNHEVTKPSSGGLGANANPAFYLLDIFFRTPAEHSETTHVELNFNTRLPYESVKEFETLPFSLQELPWFGAHQKMKEAVSSLLTQIKSRVDTFKQTETQAKSKLQKTLETQLKEAKATLALAQTEYQKFKLEADAGLKLYQEAQQANPTAPFDNAIRLQRSIIKIAEQNEKDTDLTLGTYIKNFPTNTTEIGRLAILAQAAKETVAQEKQKLVEKEADLQKHYRDLTAVQWKFVTPHNKTQELERIIEELERDVRFLEPQLALLTKESSPSDPTWQRVRATQTADERFRYKYAERLQRLVKGQKEQQ
jgi:hypothetical protein